MRASAKLLNPDLVGMGVLVVASFSISRILYLLDVYYMRLEVGCQVKFLAKREAYLDGGTGHEGTKTQGNQTRVNTD
ncbi:MAG: hypothetical protein V1897_17340 [Pseudomonadota bacterium]